MVEPSDATYIYGIITCLVIPFILWSNNKKDERLENMERRVTESEISIEVIKTDLQNLKDTVSRIEKSVDRIESSVDKLVGLLQRRSKAT